jgi:hypothetical protein
MMPWLTENGLFGKPKEKLGGESNNAYRVRMEHRREVERQRAELIK